MTRQMLTLHRWLGLAAGGLILVAGATALGLNHEKQIRGWVEQGQAHAEGPYAHYVQASLGHPRDPRRMLLGNSHGLFRTEDGGASWQPVATPVAGTRVRALVADPRSPEGLYALAAGGRVWRSSDFGRRWQAVDVPATAVAGTIEALHLAPAGGLVLATNDGLFIQAGDAWRHLAPTRVPAVENGKRLQRFVAELHMGGVWGTYGVPVTDAAAIALITLTLSGYFLFVSRELKIRLARRRARLARLEKAVPGAPAPALTR